MTLSLVASGFAQSLWPPERADAPLASDDLKKLSRMLQEDAGSCFYSGMISIADAIRGFEQFYYSWSIVKFYYSAFYLLCSALAMNEVCIFYKKRAAHSIDCRCGALPEKIAPASEGRSTHRAVIALFEKRFAGHRLLSQPIAGLSGPKWLLAKREEVNYVSGRFAEPVCPTCLKKLVQLGTRRALTAYLEDADQLYSFDEDHAVVAYPLEIANEIARMQHETDLSLLKTEERHESQK